MATAKSNYKSGNRFSGPFRHVLDKAKLFMKPPGDRKKNEPDATSRHRDRLKELLERVEQFKEHIDSVVQDEAIQSSFHAYLKETATSGFYDGVNGAKNHSLQAMARLKAEDMYVRYCYELSYQQVQQAEAFSTKEQVSLDKIIQVALHHDYQNYLQHHRKFNERGSTILEIVIYFTCFLIIFFADLPLAIDLLRRLFPDDPEGSLEWGNIGQHLNAVWAALGLAASTIYIKVWYDEFVGRKYGHAVISKKKFEELFNRNVLTTDKNTPSSHLGNPLDQSEKDAIETNEKAIRRNKKRILIFTFLVIAVLGVFRASAWFQMRGAVAIPGVLISITMIFLTLLFSIISGVCLSIALSSTTIHLRLKKGHLESAKLEAEQLAASNELAQIKGKQAGLASIIARLGNGKEWKDYVAQTIQSFYDKGFNEGAAEPEYFIQDLDFFDRVLFWRNHKLAGSIQKSSKR